MYWHYTQQVLFSNHICHFRYLHVASLISFQAEETQVKKKKNNGQLLSKSKRHPHQPKFPNTQHLAPFLVYQTCGYDVHSGLLVRWLWQTAEQILDNIRHSDCIETWVTMCWIHLLSDQYHENLVTSERILLKDGYFMSLHRISQYLDRHEFFCYSCCIRFTNHTKK